MIEQYLRSTVHDNPRSWIELLLWVELWYNTSYHHSLGISPFQALYGRPPPELIDYRPGDSNMEAVDILLKQRDLLLWEFRVNLQVAQERMKKYADRKRRPFKFEVGNWVWLRLQPYRQNLVNHWSCLKLTKRFYGPYQIVRKVSSVAYRLKLPPDNTIFPVFHIALLKPFQGNPPEETISPLPPLAKEAHPVIFPSKIITYRQV